MGNIMSKVTKYAVVLLSGGLDSAVTLAKAKEDGYEVYPLTFDYGQRHDKELQSAQKIALHYNVPKHMIFKLDLTQIGGSALTDKTIQVPRIQDAKDIGSIIPITYVPARNTIFLSIALGYAESVGANSIYIGANALDYSGYPDCRPEFFEAFQKVSELGTKKGIEGNPIKIIYPLIDLTKAEIVKMGRRLDVPLHLTWSCYNGEDKACRKCDSCILRLKGFSEAGYEDPIEYEEGK
jgi:7-cyano-7-deazaguanine synthase